jgi:hypothetical protein
MAGDAQTLEQIIQVLDFLNKLLSSKFQVAVPSPVALVEDQGLKP